MAKSEKQILILGGSGFLGENLKKYLVKHSISFYSPTPTELDIFKPLQIEHNYSNVIYLSETSGVPRSWQEPGDFFKHNSFGVMNVADFCRQSNAQLILLSGYLYGIPKESPVKEDHPIEPNNPYAYSKKIGEDIVRFYSENLGLKSVILRPFNIYGPGQPETFLIPKIIEQVRNSKKSHIEVFDLEPRRDFVFIEDVVSAIIKLIDYPDFDVFNIASGKSHSVLEVINAIQKVAGSNKNVISLNQIRKSEIKEVSADISKLKNAVDWSPQYDLEKGVEKLLG
jgi:nucleoside-diphosphate-sugar epimerase